MSPRPLSQPVAPARRGRRRTILVLGLAAVLLIPVSRIYLARHAAAAGSRESAAAFLSPAPGAATKAASASAALPKEAWHEVAARAGVDASNFYKNAFVLCAALTDEEKKMFRQPLAEADAEKAAALFKKIQPILELLRQGAEADYCEWGLGPLNFDAPLPHLGKAQELGRLAQWSAGYRFPSDPQGALGDLATQARLGDHLADSVIGWLVQMSLDGGANKVLRENAGLLDEAGALQAQEFLRSSSVEQNVARAFAAESAAVEAAAKKLAAQTPAERMKLLHAYESSEEAGPSSFDGLFQDKAALNAEFQYLRVCTESVLGSEPSCGGSTRCSWAGGVWRWESGA